MKYVEPTCKECERLRRIFTVARELAEATYMPGNMSEREAVIDALRAYDCHFDAEHRYGGRTIHAEQARLIEVAPVRLTVKPTPKTIKIERVVHEFQPALI
jgi:hypothetical protein